MTKASQRREEPEAKTHMERLSEDTEKQQKQITPSNHTDWNDISVNEELPSIAGIYQRLDSKKRIPLSSI